MACVRTSIKAHGPHPSHTPHRAPGLQTCRSPPHQPTLPGPWAFTADELNEVKLLIGNQVLLRAADNTELGNGPFSEKKAVLTASKLELTKEVGACGDWTPATIHERGERLGAAAVTTWPRSLS